MLNVTIGSANIYNKVNLIDVMSKSLYNNDEEALADVEDKYYMLNRCY